MVVWDNAPEHQTRLARETAEAVGIVLVSLPYRSPELMPCEAGALWAAWRELKRTVAANRADADVEELAARAVAWLDARIPTELLRIAGLRSSRFDWLPAYAGTLSVRHCLLLRFGPLPHRSWRTMAARQSGDLFTETRGYYPSER